ncbi:ankyrin repeat-containing domain protein [Amylocarpus encephaloides]|uniref:Ankyrin repeat-containing domain protein n=1 Tax=Amylocarpus encephaloides TaxID=45428 RepID=A0A9P7YL58_9HELO|nr:ankyrin repeat-containing domain protein [Amylocarpus encephaloides]
MPEDHLELAIAAACDAGDVVKLKDIFETSVELDEWDTKVCLDRAIQKNQLEIARYVLKERGAGPPFYLPDLSEHASVDMLKLLAEYGLDIKETGHNLLPKFVNNREAIDWILEQGVDINQPMDKSLRGLRPGAGWEGERDNTVEVLNEAAAQGNIEMFDYLVSRGAKAAQSIALHKSTRCMDPVLAVAMLTHLVERYNLDVNADDKTNNLRWFSDLGSGDPEPDQGTPLTCAIERGNIPAMEVLLDYGADPSVGYETAVKCTHQEAIQLCLKHGGGAKKP